MNPGTGKYETTAGAVRRPHTHADCRCHPCEKSALAGALEAGENGIDPADPCWSRRENRRSRHSRRISISANAEIVNVATAMRSPREPCSWFAKGVQNC